MLITFEGIDGSGKSTQIALLKEALAEQGLTARVFREPGGTDVSEMIRGMLLNPELDIDPVTELLLFSSARSQLVAEKLQPLLEENEIVILDRFFDSTTAYQGYGRNSLPIAQIQQINEVATHGIKPDVTFYLQVSPEEAAARTSRFQKDRMEQAGNSFFQKVFHGFEKMAKEYPRFRTIKSADDPKTVHQEILKHLEPLLKEIGD
ncbi:dTMP kinase [Gracilimonas mengyeensis]|uniref:Thymidylate kinase n=1 Tax=Gracilimonas mengyeensis TaxID=1302730 RepID=A0A521ALJ2_9BACT|nr:dTMP kinase [Gracilimonas mengyeensis]SMO35653.1 dTMP kinase [Gracilimonas mengyeensis]